MSQRSRMFVGSSREGLPVGRAIQIELDRDCEVTLWTQGVFGLGEGTLESLVRIAPQYDFAVLVLSADDLLRSRGETEQAPRDNVLFELGLFMGAIGRDRTFIVHSRAGHLRLPSDLAGVTTATFEPRSDGNVQAALGAVCGRLLQAVGALGRRLSPAVSMASRGPRTLSVPPAILVSGGRDPENTKAIEAAYEFGRIIAARDVRLLSGIAVGVDEAFCRGAVETLSAAGKDPKRVLTCYTGRGYPTAHRFGKFIESRFRSRQEGVPELITESDIGVLFGGSRGTQYLGVVTLLEGRFLIPAASTGGAASDLYAYSLSRFEAVFAGRLDRQSFTDLADVNSTPSEVACACLRIVEQLMSAN